MVDAKILFVDGLSRLPPLRLKSDETMDEEKTPRGSSFGSAVHEEQKIDDPLLTEESRPISLPKDNDKDNDRTSITSNTVESPGPIDTDIDPIAATTARKRLTANYELSIHQPSFLWRPRQLSPR